MEGCRAAQLGAKKKKKASAQMTSDGAAGYETRSCLSVCLSVPAKREAHLYSRGYISPPNRAAGTDML